MLSIAMSIIRNGRFAAVRAGVGVVSLSLMMTMIGSWLPKSTFALNSDGFSLLALKAAVTHDPHQALAGWGEEDGSPCGWEGVSCSSTSGRVTELALPDKGLTGYIPSELGFLLTLRRLSLPHNNLSNPIPTRLLAIPALASLDLSHNSLTGPIPDQIRLLTNLTILDLSSNALSGPLPPPLAQLPSLAGTLNLSYNRFSGPIPTAFARFPLSLSLDLRHNNLSGPIPQIGSLLNQGPTAFAGNPYLCGFPLQAPCSGPDEGTTTTSPSGADNYNLSMAPTAATAGGHPNPSSLTDSSSSTKQLSSNSTFPKITILASGVALILAAALVLLVLCVRCLLVRRRRRRADAVGGGEKQHARAAAAMVTLSTKTVVELDDDDDDDDDDQAKAQSRRREAEEVVDADDYHHSSSSSYVDKMTRNQINQNGGELRVLDEGFGVGLEELLRASAYVVGKSRSGIVYKVVVGKGVAVAVRRLSELGGVQGSSSSGRSGDQGELEAEVETIGRVRHPNLVRLRAYYFAPDERLLVSDYIPNGTLHSALHAAGALSTPHLPWTVRLKIAQGAARGIAYIHEFSPGKYVHGSIKSSKLLLGEDHQPYVSGFGLAQLISCARRGSTDCVRKRQNSFYSAAAPVLKSSLPTSTASSYSAPEARGGGNGHTQKCDVYAFGIVLLEVLTGRLPDPSPESNGMDLERFVRQAFKEERPLSDIVDPLLLHEVYAKKQVLATFHIALGCTEYNPEARPRMKTVSECLERVEYL